MAGANESSEMRVRHWVLPAAGGRYGPVDAEGLAEWARQGRVPGDARIEQSDLAEPVLAVAHPALRAFFAAPPTSAGTISRPDPVPGAASALVPYTNGMALAAYYVGVFSLVPGLALVLGPLAVLLGVLGLRAVREQPRIGGRVHAWVGVGLGAATAVVNAGVLAWLLLR